MKEWKLLGSFVPKLNYKGHKRGTLKKEIVLLYFRETLEIVMKKVSKEKRKVWRRTIWGERRVVRQAGGARRGRGPGAGRRGYGSAGRRPYWFPGLFDRCLPSPATASLYSLIDENFYDFNSNLTLGHAMPKRTLRSPSFAITIPPTHGK